MFPISFSVACRSAGRILSRRALTTRSCFPRGRISLNGGLKIGASSYCVALGSSSSLMSRTLRFREDLSFLDGFGAADVEGSAGVETRPFSRSSKYISTARWTWHSARDKYLVAIDAEASEH